MSAPSHSSDGSSSPRNIGRDAERPSHPTGRAIILMVGVTLLILAIAVLASFNKI